METRRARPWLGTLVEVRIGGLDERDAIVAIDAAFAEIAAVHRLMSFHAEDSDLSRLNREAARETVSVDARTVEVIKLALEFARASNGCFDPTIAGDLVRWGLLPRPPQAPSPHSDTSWRDVDVRDDGRIRFARPLWLDLGGIAKGYAVDRAVDRLRAFGVAQACVNAGGDLRRIGSGSELVHVRSPHAPRRAMPALALGEGSVASSGGYFDRRMHGGVPVGPHVDGRQRAPIGLSGAVTVVADRCVIADALTKVVLADATIAEGLLETYSAQAMLFGSADGSRLLGRAA